jgi:hypothetical protein
MLGLLLCLPFILEAQSILERPVTGAFEQRPIPEILTDIEAAHPVRFFFKESELPGEMVTVSFDETPLSNVLDRLLQGTLLGYFPYRESSIVILPRRMIEEVYSADFYKALEESLASPEEDEEDQVITVGDIGTLRADGKAIVRGTLVEAESGEPVIGASILWPDSEVGTVSDENGQFESELFSGLQELRITFVGYKDVAQLVKILGNGEITVEMVSQSINLEEVVVEAQAADANVQRAQIGVERLDINNVKKLPSLLGEANILNTLLLYPGVSTVGEGATGFNVRGGEADQNLYLQDEGFLFNANHALGFFSTFNDDLISSVELYKGNIPAQFGGRLASVLDVEMRDGSFERFGIKGSVGPVTSRLSVEGPVINGKSSFLIGGRMSYIDWMLDLIQVAEVRRSSAFFYDANLRFTQKLNDKNTLVLSGYFSEDDFTYNEEFGFDYSTIMGQAIYKKIFSEKVYSRFSATYSRYASAQTDLEGLDAARLSNDISYLKGKGVVTFSPGSTIKMDAGLSGIYYSVAPRRQEPSGDRSLIDFRELESEQALESAAFFNAEWNVSPALLISAGFRLGYYQFLGPKTVFEYEEGQLPSRATLIDTVSYGSGKAIASYGSMEPRLSFRYRLDPENSLKAGYSRTTQFINQIFNTDSPTPNSNWQLSTSHIEPTRSHNFSAGFFRNFQRNRWETSAEVYYRWIDQIFDYRDFADLTVNETLETELLPGVGRAYGLELSVVKKEGLLNGRLSYTYSRSERQIEGINKGEWYPSYFDQPHSGTLVLNYQPNQRHTLTVSFNYNTGRPATAPLGNFESTTGLVIPVYSERNQTRIPDYHRLDVSYTLGQGYNRTKRLKTSWTIAIYNLYGRRNAYSVFFTEGPFQSAQANKLSVLGTAFPSVTVNFEFL